MKERLSLRKGLAVVVIFIFIELTITPFISGTNINKEFDKRLRYAFPENIEENGEFLSYMMHIDQVYKMNQNKTRVSNSYSIKDIIYGESQALMNGPLDSPWPLYCHDVRHTGRSPYSTADNPYNEMWSVKFDGGLCTAIAIDNDSVIYTPGYDLKAYYSNGTLKWNFPTPGWYEKVCPAIADDGTIYIGTHSASTKYFYAINPNGTLKWSINNGYMDSSPTIGEDGTIYFAQQYWDHAYITALYPNGTVKWKTYISDMPIYSTPAIGEDGTLYFGSHDDNFYAFHPNGTLKWSYKTGGWIHCSPTIAEDGTIYVSSNDDKLYAFYPNGTVKWSLNLGSAAWGAPVLDEDGTLYFGVWDEKFYAINPNGTTKWEFDCSGRIWHSSACLSSNGVIYFGTTNVIGGSAGRFYALNRDGEEIWSEDFGLIHCPPIIDEHGNLYVCTETKIGGNYDWYLRAIGRGEVEADAHGPYFGIKNENVQFNGSATGGYPPYSWLWNFGDNNFSEEQNPEHMYTLPGNYTVILTAIDESDNTSNDTTWALIKESNYPPYPPEKPTGPTTGITGIQYSYSTSTSDSDPEDKIYYRWDWDDGSFSDWLGPYNSGEICTEKHTWDEMGCYQVRVKAKDNYEDESEWSETLDVEISAIKAQLKNRILFLTAIIENIGDHALHNIEWRLRIEPVDLYGKPLGRIDYPKEVINGTLETLKGHRAVRIRTRIRGIGLFGASLEYSAEGIHYDRVADGFVLGPFILLLFTTY